MAFRSTKTTVLIVLLYILCITCTSSCNTTYSPPSANVTYSPPPSNVTYSPPSANVTYSPPSSNVTYSQPSSNVTYSQPSSNVTYTPPSSNVTHAPPSNKKGKCLTEIQSFAVCVTPSPQCCTLLNSMTELQAAQCLCNALTANVIGLVKVKVNVPLIYLLSGCGQTLPQGFKC